MANIVISEEELDKLFDDYLSKVSDKMRKLQFEYQGYGSRHAAIQAMRDSVTHHLNKLKSELKNKKDQ